MDRHLRPATLETDPDSPEAAKIWRHWSRTFENFLRSLTSEAQQPDKLSALINFVGPSVYELIADAETFEDAFETLRLAYDKPKSEIFARHLLSTCKQEHGQSLDQYLQRLRNLAKDCNFKAVTADQYKNEQIRDTFIRGILSQQIRQRLLEKQNPDLQTTFESARSLEMAERHSHSYQTQQVVAAINNTPGESPEGEPEQPQATSAAATNPGLCFFCGFKRHSRSKCPARDAVCKACGKKGHFAKACQSTKAADRAVSSATSTNILATTSVLAGIECLEQAMIRVQVFGEAFSALVDSGSTESFVRADIAKDRSWAITNDYRTVSMASTSLSYKTLGLCSVDLKYGGTSYKSVKLSLLPNACAPIILGHDFINKHRELKIKCKGSMPTLVVSSLSAAKISPPPLFAKLTGDCKPIATKSRRHSHVDEAFIQKETERLLKDGIIEKSASPWRAQVLVTTNENHKKRMVVDYSQTVNRYTYLDAYPQKRIDTMVEDISKYQLFSTLDLKSAYHQIPLREEEKQYTAFEAAGNLYQFTRVPFGVTNGVSCFQRVIDNLISEEGLQATFAYVDNVTVCGNTKEEHDSNLQKLLDAASKYGLTFNDAKSTICVKEIDLLGYRVSNGQIRPDPERLEPLRSMPPPTNSKSQKRAVGMFAYYSGWIRNYSDKIKLLNQNDIFPLPRDVLVSFQNLKKDLEEAVLSTPDLDKPLVVETDASDVAISATLNQDGRPVAFFSRTLSPTEKNYPAVEKEAQAIVEAIRRWKHYLLYNNFKLITDQEAISFIYEKKRSGKIKNDKIQRWRIELSPYSYDITHRPGVENVGPDTLSRCGAATAEDALMKLHEDLCHPGSTRLMHFVRSKNLPYSTEEIRRASSKCSVCSELKPRFFKPEQGTLVKATQPMERLSIDFKGPLPSSTRNKYLLTVIDEFSRFPFAYPCQDMTAGTVINKLTQLFSVFGMPQYIHSDRGSSFMSNELKSFLHGRGVATSRTTPYNPQGNGQCERLNQTLWKAITLSLKSKGLDTSQWELVLLDALHSIRSLLCTETNCTPHERMFDFQRRSTNGSSMPTWLVSPGSVYLKRRVRDSKYDPLVDEVELIDANPMYAHIRHQDGRESTVSLRQLAPIGEPQEVLETNQNSDNILQQSMTTSEPGLLTIADAEPPSVHIPDVEQHIERDHGQVSTPDLELSMNSHQATKTQRSESKKGFIRTSSYNLRSGPK